MIKIVLLALVLCGVSAIRPGCKTRYELRMKWTVPENINRYWECSRWGVSVQKSCPIDTHFSAPYQTCVPEKNWERFPYYGPPTTVNDFVDECKEEELECINPCIDVVCEDGIIVDNKCECPAGWILVNGACTPGLPGIEDCGENGIWNEIEGRCICNDGSQLINGWCVSSQGICDGAPDSAYVRGTLDCLQPACTDEQYWANIHWPTRNPRTFWQCPGINWVQEMPCGAATCFSYEKQTCVHARDWVNECN